MEIIYSKPLTSGNYKIVIEEKKKLGVLILRSCYPLKRTLQADSILIMDAGQFDRGVPALVYSLRGLAYFEITCAGPAFDVHSGQFGGGVPTRHLSHSDSQSAQNDQDKSPFQAFTKMSKNQNLGNEEMAQLPFQEESIKKSWYSCFSAGNGLHSLESMTVRPTLTSVEYGRYTDLAQNHYSCPL